jgi:hypothetical protein
MNLEQIKTRYNIYHSFRTFFDSGSYQFERTTFEEKLNTLARLVYCQLDLHEVIKEYKKHYTAERNSQPRNNLFKTLVNLISYLRFNVRLDLRVEKECDGKSEKELIQILSADLKKHILPNINLDEYIRVVATATKTDEILSHNQHQYFKINYRRTNEILAERDAEEKVRQERSYIHLNNFYEQILLPAFREGNISQVYPQMGMSPVVEELVRKHFTPNEFHSNLEPQEKSEKIFPLIKNIFEIVYLGAPVEEPVYFIRHNFTNEKGKAVLPTVEEKNLITILVDQEKELENWNSIEQSDISLNNGTQFIKFWFDIQKKLEFTDVLVISQYKPMSCKIGLIRRGTKFSTLPGQNDFKTFQLENTEEFFYARFPLFYALLPKYGTISPVKQRINFIRHLYYKTALTISLDNLTNKQVEHICAEWLRSEHAPKDFQLKYQLLTTGGNMPDIDICGRTHSDVKLIAQVCDTTDKALIKRKSEKLLNQHPETLCLMFSQTESNQPNITYIKLKEIWDALYNDANYRPMLEEMIKM